MAGFLFLAVLIGWAYWPSLAHGPRGDQLNYLAEMSSRQGFTETVFGSFDLNRTRSFGPGDELAFRPVFYFVLGLEKYFFGYDFTGWQFIGLLAHLFACGALYALLCRIRGGLFAFLGMGLFALAPVNIEAVVWHHITPYLLFAGCVLMALRGLYAAEHDEAKVNFHTAAAVGWMLPAVFLYETGVWYALCMGVFLWSRGRRAGAYALGGLIMFYAVANVADLFFRHVDAALQAGQVAGHASFGPTFANAALLGKWFISALFFLAPSDLVLISRTMVSPELLGWAWPWGSSFNFAIGLGIAVLIAMIVLLAQNLLRKGMGKDKAFLALCLAMAAGYLAVIEVGRINVLGVFGMRVGLYYAYNFLVLVFVVAALLSPGISMKLKMPEKVVKALGVGVIVLMIAVHVSMVRRVTVQMARDNHVPRTFLGTLDRYVKAHAKEPGFSFYAGPECPGNYTPDWVSRRGDPPGRLYTLAEALYPLQFTRDNPKYVIKFEH